MEISELITQAQQMGINIYPRDGQINLSIPWSVNDIPMPAREMLVELKHRKSEVMAYFALTESDIRLILAALKVQGVRVVPDPQTKIKIYITPEAPGRCNEIAIKLINKLHDCKKSVVAYLEEQAPDPG